MSESSGGFWRRAAIVIVGVMVGLGLLVYLGARSGYLVFSTEQEPRNRTAQRQTASPQPTAGQPSSANQTVGSLKSPGLPTLLETRGSGSATNSLQAQAANALAVSQIKDKRESRDSTVWATEVEAQKYETPFIDLWDNLRNTEDKGKILAEFPFDSVTIGIPGEPSQIDHGIELMLCNSGTKTLTAAQWQEWLQELEREGFRLIQSEWHHSKFDGDSSVFSISLDVVNDNTQSRFAVRGQIVVEWKPGDDPVVASIDATDLTVQRLEQPPLFKQAGVIEVETKSRTMIIARDVNGDGLSDIVSPTMNALFINKGNFEFERQRLFSHVSPKPIATAVMADFTNDGQADIVASAPGVLLIYVADQQGKFTTPFKIIAAFSGETPADPMVITAGDIDADGDLDVYLGHYTLPYERGQMPTPYYDANDGYLDFMFRNDGNGEFTEFTQQANLVPKRRRRTYAASLADIDKDSDLDLIVISDFSGVDVHANDGTGKFTDITDQIDERHAFGMSLTFADYDLDSNLDFLMVGMSSTTAKRLHQMGLGLDEFPEHQEKRPAMGYGNRLLLGNSKGDFRQAPFNSTVARTGWSWGSTSFDFDNDMDADLFIANGHRSRESARDYCTTFWRHDIYEGDSRLNDGRFNFFRENINTCISEGISWNGFEHNALLMNNNEDGFANIGFVAGVASEFDSRHVISDDLDGDGQLDLIVGEWYWKENAPKIKVYQNQGVGGANNWIAVRLEKARYSGIGTTVVAYAGDREFITNITSGDSHSSQHAPVAHFGLGEIDSVDKIEIRWPDGKVDVIDSPAINQRHQFP